MSELDTEIEFPKKFNIIEDFFNEFCEKCDDREISVWKFYDKFFIWKERNNQIDITKREVYDFMRFKLGINCLLKDNKKRSNIKWRYYKGIKWK